jgi:hypothetical protein
MILRQNSGKLPRSRVHNDMEQFAQIYLQYHIDPSGKSFCSSPSQLQ